MTVGDVFDKISRRLVPFEMVDKVFKDLTSEGGKFYQMQEIQSETLRGKISNLSDAFAIMFNEIGSKNSGLLKGSVDAIRSLAENYEKVGRIIVSLISTYGAYRATLALVSVWQSVEVLAMTKGIGAIGKFGKAMRIAAADSKAFALAQKLIAGINPWTALAAAVIGVGTYFASAAVQAHKFKKELEGIASVKFEETKRSVDDFNKLADELENTTRGTQAYRDVIDKLNRKYGEYLPNLLTEANALETIRNLRNEIANSIAAKGREYAEDQIASKISDEYTTKIGDRGDKLVKAVSKMSVGGTEVGKDAAGKFIDGFKQRLLDEGGDAISLYEKEFERFFGSYNTSNAPTEAIKRFADVVRGQAQSIADAGEIVDKSWGSFSGYSSFREMQIETPIIKDFNDKLEELRTTVKDTGDEWKEMVKGNEREKLLALRAAFVAANTEAVDGLGVWDNKIKEIDADLKKLEDTPMSSIQKRVSGLITGSNKDLMPEGTDNLFEYGEKLRKEYKAVVSNAEDASNSYEKLLTDKRNNIEVDAKVFEDAKALNAQMQERKKIIESVYLSLFGEPIGSSNGKATSGSKGKSEAQKELETRIDLLKKLQTAYEKLAEFMDEDKIPGVLTNLFSASGVTDDMVRDLDFRKQLINAANELAKFDNEAAERLRNYIGYDEASEQIADLKKIAKAKEDAAKASARYTDYMTSWVLGEDMEGENAEFKLSKTVSDYSKALQQIENKTEEARQRLYDKADAEKKAGIWSALGFASDYNDITNKSNQAKTNALATYAQKGREAIKAMYEEWKRGDIDFNNLTDKSLAKIREMQATLQGIDGESLVDKIFSKEQMEDLAKLGLDIDGVTAALATIVGIDLDEVEELADDKKIEKIHLITQGVSELTSAFNELAESSDLGGLSTALEMAGQVADMVGSIDFKAIDNGDYLGSIVGVFTTMVNILVDNIVAMQELEYSISLARIEAERLKATIALEDGVDTIFGKNAAREIQNASEQLRKYNELAQENVRIAEQGRKFKVRTGTGVTSLGYTLDEMMKELGYDMYDQATGMLNAEGLQAILDTYDRLRKSDRVWIEDAIKNAELYTEALEQINDVAEDIFGQMASDLTDTFINNFLEMGYAVDNLGDTFENLGDTILRSMLQSFIIQEVLNKYKQEVISLTQQALDGESSGMEVAARLAKLADEIKVDMEKVAPEIQALIQAFYDRGLMSMDSTSGSDSLANGIKGITEDTANLLASYVNAIRADVSRGCVQRDEVLRYLQQITTYTASPNLMDYLNKIQANTYDIANHTNDILAELRSMMTIEGGATALRVYS